MRRFAGALLLGTLGAACGGVAPPSAPAPADDLLVVHAAPGTISAQDRKEIERGYRELRQGKAASAERALRRLALKRPALVPARVALGQALVRLGRSVEAARLFEAILAERPDDLGALLGSGEAAAKTGDLTTALAFYRRAVRAQPTAPAAVRRLAETKLAVTERGVDAARAALADGRHEVAVDEYRRAIEAVPEVSGLRVELADILVERGDREGAAEVLAGDTSGDRQVLSRLGQVELALARYDRALAAFRRVLEQDPRDTEAQSGALEARRALEFLQMPEEYQRIYTAPQISRADLAALIAVKVTALSRVGAAEPRVAVDISGSWAKEHIIKALALEILNVYPNHTFQPGAVARRGDVARAAARVLDLLGIPPGPPVTVTDMSRSNLFYDAAVRVSSLGIMPTTEGGAFEAWRPVSGPQAVQVVDALIRVVGP